MGLATYFLQISKIFFCNTCQPTIFVNFVIQKLLHIRYMYIHYCLDSENSATSSTESDPLSVW